MKRVIVWLILETIFHLPCTIAKKTGRAHLQRQFATEDFAEIVSPSEGDSRASESIPDAHTSVLETQLADVDRIVLRENQALEAHQQTFAADTVKYVAQSALSQVESHEKATNPYEGHSLSATTKLIIVIVEILIFGSIHCVVHKSPAFAANLPWRIILVCCAIGVCIGLGILTLLETFWTIKDGVFWLNTTGTIAILELISITLLVPLTFYQAKAHIEEDEQEEKKPEQTTGTLTPRDKETIKSVFEKALCSGDLVKVAFMGGRAFFNSSMCFFAEENLPPRDPNSHLNGMIYIVVIFEYLYTFVHLVAIFGGCIYFVLMPVSISDADFIKLVVHSTEKITGSSFLQALPFAHPLELWDNLSVSKLFNVGTLLTLANIPMAGMAILVKINSLDFITTTDFWDWASKDYIQLVSFINNLAGMAPSSNSTGIKAIFKKVDMKNPLAEANFRKELAGALAKEYGRFPALAKYSSLTLKDVIKLMQSTNGKSMFKNFLGTNSGDTVEQGGTPMDDVDGGNKKVRHKVCC